MKYDGASFQVDGETYASEREALVLAAKNPLDPAHMVLVVAGNDALRTVKAQRAEAPAEYAIFDDGSPTRTGFIGYGATAGAAPEGRRRR